MSDTKPYEPLSKRETQILALLAADLSDREIADRLYIAYTTVKWYNRQIFNKLGVENRRQAVDRARALGLLDPAKSRNVPPQNRPPQLTPFVGRVHEIDDLIRLFNDPDIRLVTLLAPGGMGKTRLALQIADLIHEDFSDGPWLVFLAAVPSSDYVPAALVDALGLMFAADGRSLEQQVYDFLRPKELLLVLDNFEHLLTSTPFLSTLLSTAPKLKVIVTSREKLNITAETVYRLGGMPYPTASTQETLQDYAAVQLFLQSAYRAAPQLVVDDDAAVARICQLVQGMPLALELAAGWVSTLSLAAIADEIHRSIDFLQTTMRDIPERLQSIRAVCDTTWIRLSEPEQRIFRRLSVFWGGCTREAVQEVTGAELTTLAGLVAKALLWYQPQSNRYEIHELLRQYAHEKLVESGEEDVTQDRHYNYFGKLASEWGKALKTPRQLQALEILEADFENFQAAFERTLKTRQSALVEPFTHLWYFYEIRGRYPEGLSLISKTIDAVKGQDSVALARMLAGKALFLERHGLLEGCYEAAETSIAILKRLGIVQDLPWAMMELGNAEMNAGQLDQALAIYQEAFAIAQRHHDDWAESCIHYLFGIVAFQKQDFDRAREELSRAYVLLKDAGNIWGVSFALTVLGDVAFEVGDNEEARRLYEAGLLHARKVSQRGMASNALIGLSFVAFREKDWKSSQRFIEEALQVERSLGRLGRFLSCLAHLAHIQQARGQIEEARQYLHEALSDADVIDEYSLLMVLLTAAELSLETERIEQAVEIAGFIEHHPLQKYFDNMNAERLQSLFLEAQGKLAASDLRTYRHQGPTRSKAYLLATLSTQFRKPSSA